MTLKTKTHLSVQNILQVEPDTESARPFGYVDRGKGATYFLNQPQAFNFISILEFLPEKGLRGNHYHHKKHEYFYIQEGSLIGYFWDPENPDDRLKLDFKPGDFFDIKPGLAHGFEACEKTIAIELSPQEFDREDHVYVENPFLVGLR